MTMKLDSLPAPLGRRRKAVTVSPQALVHFRQLTPDQALPLVVEPAVAGFDAIAWLKVNRTAVETRLIEHGAILFRGFGLNKTADFESFVEAAVGGTMAYHERSSPRHEVGREIYTSTDYPAGERIFPHNEHSYRRTFPLRLFFFCQVPAESGGETPLADSRRVLARISAATQEKFTAKGWMYVRNYGEHFSLNWQTTFQTSDRGEVEEYCRNQKIEFEWRPGGLTTRQVRPAFAIHPSTGERLFFNHATFFHISTLPPETRGSLLAQFGEGELPNNTYYGDGSPIEPAVLEELRNAYAGELVAFSWRRGDVILLDNMLTAHAREPFSGERRILFAMACPVTRTDL